MLKTQYLSRIRSAMAILEDEVHMNVICNRLDANISSETVWCGVLNLLYDWELKNANSLRQNYPAVDLVDPARGIAVQVTSDNSREKIQKTLDKLEKADVKCKKLVMMLLSKAKQYKPFQSDGVELVILDRGAVSLALETVSTDKLEKLADYLDRELGLNRDVPVQLPAHQLPGVPSASSSFVAGSRDEELKQIRQILAQKQPAFLWGLGGIGKTETAIQLAKHHAPAKGAYFLRFRDSMRQTILDADFFQRADGERRDLDYDTRMGILRTEYPGALLIIDNFDCPGKSLADLRGEAAFSDLTMNGLQLVFTTRNQVNHGGVEIKSLGTDALLKLMREILNGREVPEEDLRELIDVVDGHTLMVDLMAKTLLEGRGGITTEDMLETFRMGKLKGRKLPNVERVQHGGDRKGRIDDHLRTLFDMSNMNPSEMAVLRYATLLPEDGMDTLLFRDCLDNQSREVPRKWHEMLFGKKRTFIPSEEDAFTHLSKTGWLRIDDATNLLTIHPVIREVCWETLEPTEDDCLGFLKNLRHHFNDDGTYASESCSQIAKCFSLAADKLEDKIGILAFYAGNYWSRLGRYQIALPYGLQCLKRNEDNHLPVDVTYVYNFVGKAYHELGEYEKALEYLLSAIGHSESRFSLNYKEYAMLHSNIGMVYCALGDYREALAYHEKSKTVLEKAFPPDHVEFLAIYGNIGGICSELGDFNKALEYYEKALMVAEKNLPAGHALFALFYCNIGSIYSKKKEYQSALEYDKKALAIYEKALPGDHPDLAFCCLNLGKEYAHLGDPVKALEFQQKAHAILEAALPPNHPNLAHSFKCAGRIYRALGEKNRALSNFERALAIREEALPAEHPDHADSYHDLARVYRDMGDYFRAEEFLKKALDIWQRALPAGHYKITDTEEKLAELREEMAQQEN